MAIYATKGRGAGERNSGYISVFFVACFCC